jgi:natural product biosynthesis luciferase-like monooxygenase protein
MLFGLMFFSSAELAVPPDRYRLLFEAAKAADDAGLGAIWTPERHFDKFGGLFPNPALTSAALAVVTKRLDLRAGSLIAPLHDSIRIAEEWSVVDNLSGGRAAISFGSGWNTNDFVFFPDRYASRQAQMFTQIEEIRTLWRGESIVRTNGSGQETYITLEPRPVRRELPVWVTSSGSAQTFTSAGRIGANLLTHLIGQDLPGLAEKIRLYRTARAEAGHDPAAGTVTLMLHTYVRDDREEARNTAWAPFREYLRSAVKLEQRAAAGGGSISCGYNLPQAEDGLDNDPEVMEELLDLTCERYMDSSALIGSPESCLKIIESVESIGVDEIACLVDFGVPATRVVEGVSGIGKLRERAAGYAASGMWEK